MKTLKYSICFCVFFIGVLIIGESQVFRLESFYSPYRYTTLYLQYGQKEQDMIKDTLQAAAKNGVEVFTFTKTTVSNQTNIKIYGSPAVEEHINKDQNIYSKRYKSLFLGDIQFSFHKLETIQGLKDVHDFYVIGNAQQAEMFKTDLINTYAGNFPQEGYPNNDTRYTIFAIWALMIGVTLLLTYYDMIYQKKENLIRISMGERIGVLIWRNVIVDCLSYSSIFALIYYSLRNVTSISMDLQISIVGFISLLIFNGLVYLNLRSYHLREAFSNARSSSKKLLSVNYGLKLFTVMITVFIISSNLVLVFESYSLYKQKSFFEEHQDYSYITIHYRPTMSEDGVGDPKFYESERLQTKFYAQYFSQGDAKLLSMIHTPLSTSAPTIMANANAFTYLETNIKELKQLKKDKDIYFILPQSLSSNDQILPNLIEEFSFFENQDIRNQYETVYYKDQVNLIAINENNMYGSEFVKNPIVIYNHVSPESQPLKVEPNRAVYIREIMYAITDQEFDQFVHENQLSESNAVIAKTNVLEKYNESWDIAKRILYINSVFSLLVLFLEFIIIASIIRLEYEVNAIELSIKKVLGYSIWEKNRKIILITVVTTLLSIGMALAIAMVLGIESAGYLVLGGMIILTVELLIIFLYIHKIERLKIQKILKGGNV